MVRELKSKQNPLSRIVFTIAGIILFLFGIYSVILLNNTILYIFALGSIYIIFDGFISIILQIREVLTFHFGRVIRILIGVVFLAIVLNYDITIVDPIQINVLDITIITVGTFLITYGIFWRLNLKDIKRKKKR